MNLLNILKSILVSSCLLIAVPLFAQQNVPDTLTTAVAVQDSTTQRKVMLRPKWLSGMSLSVDALGVLLAQATSYGNYEAALRLNLRQKYFPTIEVGLGVCERSNETTGLRFTTRAPYFRVGTDLNIARDKSSGNRIFVGLRYGFSTFNFDLSAPPLQDPVWPQRQEFSYTSQHSNAHWGEFVFGLEAKIWKNFHLGWTGRYRKRIVQHSPAFGQAWYIPGYGKNGGHTFGGTFNFIFDL